MFLATRFLPRMTTTPTVAHRGHLPIMDIAGPTAGSGLKCWHSGRVCPFRYNNSYWDHNSTLTAVDVTSFIAPPDVANDLFIVWVCNADTFDAASDISYNPSTSYNALLNQFISENIQAQANNLLIITQLYAKGVRTLIMPNAVDISEIPAYNAGNATAVLHAGCVDYNARLASTINQARALCPGSPNLYSGLFHPAEQRAGQRRLLWFDQCPLRRI